MKIDLKKTNAGTFFILFFCVAMISLIYGVWVLSGNSTLIEMLAGSLILLGITGLLIVSAYKYDTRRNNE